MNAPNPWRPISTAPHGTAIRLWLPDGIPQGLQAWTIGLAPCPIHEVTGWFDGQWHCGWSEDAGYGCFVQIAVRPTHWKPLDGPPT